MSNGKGDERLHARTQLPEDDMERRWQQTFGVATPSPQPIKDGDCIAIVDAGKDNGLLGRYTITSTVGRLYATLNPPPDPPDEPQ